MKFAFLFAVLGLVCSVSSSELRLTSVTLPLYLHGTDTDPSIGITAVPYVTFTSDPEWRFSAISVPFVPPSDSPRQTQDVNLTSLYRVSVSGTYKDDGKSVLVTVDGTKAVQPEGYPFTTEQVLDAVVTCVKIMYPQRPLDEGKFDVVVKRPAAKAR